VNSGKYRTTHDGSTADSRGANESVFLRVGIEPDLGLTTPRRVRSAVPQRLSHFGNSFALMRRLRTLEELIITLEKSDAFVEDLVSLHEQRNALLAELDAKRGKRARRRPIYTLVSGGH